MLLSRLQEEDAILIKEMRNHCRYLTGSSIAVKREIHQNEEELSKNSSPPPNMSLQAYEGLKCLLLQKLQGLNKQIDEAFSTYRNVLTDPTARMGRFHCPLTRLTLTMLKKARISAGGD
ncbi:unnamed protein product [Arctogadus glacialis]